MLFTISSVNHTNWYATATFYHSDGREIPSINVAYQESFDLGYFAGNEPNHWASPIGSILVQYGYGVYWCSLTIYNSAGGTWNSGNFGHFVGY
jgi:hypothetical protein